MSKKNDKKVSLKTRQRKRRLLTLSRVFRYGINNFNRNIWLTVAATAVMSVTLLIIFLTVSARQILLDTVADISRQADMSIYLKGTVDDEVVQELTSRLEKLDNVDSVRYISAEEARRSQAEQFKDSPEALEAIKEASNEMSATLRVSVIDLNDQSSLDNFVQTDELYKENRDPRREPSFSGDRRQAINTIGRWVEIASVGGSIAAIVFAAISSLVVFNTIRMAIFNRKDEIQMMKLIGAERGFIRGPFLVEATLYGIIAAIIATGAGYGLLLLARAPMSSYGVPIDNLVSLSISYVWLALLAMMLIGSAIGVISSFIATHKYLKI